MAGGGACRAAVEGLFPEVQQVERDLPGVARAAARIMSGLESGVDHPGGLLPPTPAPLPLHRPATPPGAYHALFPVSPLGWLASSSGQLQCMLCSLYRQNSLVTSGLNPSHDCSHLSLS